MMLHDEGMAQPAARGGQQHRHVAQGIGFDEIEEMLEQARVGPLEDGRPDDQRIGGLDVAQDARGIGRQLRAGKGGAEPLPDLHQVMHDEIDGRRPSDLRPDGFDERAGLGGTAKAAGNADDARVRHEEPLSGN